VSHARARLTEFGRALLIERVLEKGWSAAATAEAAGVSRATVYKWLRRYKCEGDPGLQDRSSRPSRSPRRLSAAAEARILRLRQSRKLGPHRLGALLGVPRSTCYAVLRRHQLHRLDWMDRPTAEVIRRYERERPGELIHVDIKKLARIPPGGGHRLLGRDQDAYHGHSGAGYEFIHAAVDDHSRVAYAEIHPNEQAETCTAFMARALGFFAAHGAPVERVLTDNGPGYRSHVFAALLSAAGVRHHFCRPRRPQTNGKVERFNRTLLNEWAYVRLYRNNESRARLLPDWLHRYNHHRCHTALGGLPPMARVNNLSGNYS
jgi:transposase InsO family protein